MSVNGVGELDENVIGDADKNVVGEVDDNVDEHVERDPLNKSAVDLFNAAAAVNELPAAVVGAIMFERCSKILSCAVDALNEFSAESVDPKRVPLSTRSKFMSPEFSAENVDPKRPFVNTVQIHVQ